MAGEGEVRRAFAYLQASVDRLQSPFQGGLRVGVHRCQSLLELQFTRLQSRVLIGVHWPNQAWSVAAAENSVSTMSPTVGVQDLSLFETEVWYTVRIRT